MSESDAVAGTVGSGGAASGPEEESGALPPVADVTEGGDPGVPEEAEGTGTGDSPPAGEVRDAEQPEHAEEGATNEDVGPDTGDRSDRARRTTDPLRRLEEEGEIAADYLEELLDIVDLDGDIDIDVENDRASVAIVAEGSAERDLGRLAGPQGEVLEALQELARLAVQARIGDRSRLMLDVAGFRAARRRTLEGVAARVCQEVRHTGAAVKLDPMTAFERKVVHDVVAEAGLVSESEGEEPGRRVVVHPAP